MVDALKNELDTSESVAENIIGKERDSGVAVRVGDKDLQASLLAVLDRESTDDVTVAAPSDKDLVDEINFPKNYTDLTPEQFTQLKHAPKRRLTRYAYQAESIRPPDFRNIVVFRRLILERGDPKKMIYTLDTLAWALENLGALDEALKIYCEIRATNPKDSRAHQGAIPRLKLALGIK